MVARTLSTIKWVKAYLNYDKKQDCAEQAKEAVMAAFTEAAEQKINSNHHKPTNENINENLSPINILSVDGGGARGWTLRPMNDAIQDYFDNLEGEDKGERFFNAFDLVGGTSVGGAAVLLQHKVPDKVIVSNLGQEMIKEMFENITNRKGIIGAMKAGHIMKDSRKESFQKYFGTDTPMNVSADDKVASEDVMVGPKTFVLATQRRQRNNTSSSTEETNTTSRRRRVLKKLRPKRGHNETEKKSPPPPSLSACLLRTYDKLSGHSGIEPAPGTSSIKMWEAAEATTAVPVIWGRTCAKQQSINEDLYLADGGLVANSPIRHVLQEAALLYPGRPLGLVMSVGLGRSAKDKRGMEDMYSDEIADEVKRAGGQFIRLEPIIDDAMTTTTTDPEIINKMVQDVTEYMATAPEAQHAKEMLRNCFDVNPSIRGRYTTRQKSIKKDAIAEA